MSLDYVERQTLRTLVDQARRKRLAEDRDHERMCHLCREWQHPSAFTRGKSPDGLHTWCRQCQRERRLAWRARNREREREYDRERKRVAA